MTNIGVISDTLGLLRPEAIRHLEGSDLIIHAGDIGDPSVVDGLERIAPLKVIRGNIDKWADELPDTDFFDVDGKFIYVIHNLNDLDLDPEAAEIDLLVSGHTHKPEISREGSVLFLNPGSAGPRRFSLPIVMAKVQIEGSNLSAQLIKLVGD